MTGTRTISKSIGAFLLPAFAVITVVGLCPSSALALVKISDGFGDADLNNNNTPLELADVDANLNGTISTYTPARASNPALTNPEVNSVLDANDKGIRWLSIAGFTTNNTGDPKALARIVDDTQGSMQETKASGLNITAINDGYALSYNSKGRGSSIAGFFDQTIALGPQVGDKVKVGFDMRVWRDAYNANASEAPADAELRFGLYQDTDHQLGLTNPFAGKTTVTPPATTPAVWGQQDGWFEGSRTGTLGTGDNIGATGDHGWFGTVILEDPTSILKPLTPNGGAWRIREETNENMAGANDVRILQGTNDVDTVAVPHEATPGTGDYGLVNLDVQKVYHLSLELERSTDVTTADTITATLTATDRATGISYVLSAQEHILNAGVPDGISSDKWDYFAIRNSGTDDYDMLMDNFKVELFGSNATSLAGDYNGDNKVDAADYTIWRDTLGSTTDLRANGNTSGASATVIDIDDYNVWKTNFGMHTGSGGGGFGSGTVPEPSSLLLGLLAATVIVIIRSRKL